MALAAGQRLTASLLNSLLGVTVSDTQNALANVTATGYTETFSTSNTPAAVAFVAPTSGKVLIHNSAYLDQSSAAARTYLSWILRTGASIGSGTVVQSAIDANAIENLSDADATIGRTIMVSGLTANSSYNIRQAGRVTSGTGEYQNRHLIVEPVV